MDNDTKHVLVILGFVACFGAGYFTCKTENRDSLKLGEKLSVFNTIENKLENKTDFELSDEKEAIKNAVNGYYQTDDKYFEYSFESDEDDKKEENNYDYSNNYSISNKIVYINSDSFFVDGIQGFTKFFKDNENPEIDAYIIDLRNNVGGYTPLSLNVLAYFLDQPLTVGKYHYYNGEEEELKISGTKKANGEKIIILVNEKTASSAEIFTSAMKQFYNGEVTTIGTTTKGKGTFQKIQYLSDNELVKYTAGYYTIGNWDCYDGIGITPDIEVSMDYLPDIICTDNDIQLQKALELLK